MEKNNRQKGDEAEALAVEFFKKMGYVILKRNFHYGQIAEIDIVAKDKEYLVFIEVKSGNTKYVNSLLEMITPQKQKKLRTAAKAYLQINKIENIPCRFDVLTIDFTNEQPVYEHIVNAI